VKRHSWKLDFAGPLRRVDGVQAAMAVRCRLGLTSSKVKDVTMNRFKPFCALLLASGRLVAGCPDPAVLDLFKHQIAYERQWEDRPLKGLSLIHANVWVRGSITGFYVREQLKDYTSPVRMSYIFDVDGPRGGGTCPITKDWRQCIAEFAADAQDALPATICYAELDVGSILPWQPTPDSPTKRQIASELSREIEQQWPGVLEIVIRDFNLKDSEITMYLKMRDGDEYHGCGFHAMREPHCEGWHLFGMSPLSGIKKWIFDRPYKLK
jgi:hypothetical protein